MEPTGKVALATCQRLSSLTDDDVELVEDLRAVGVDAQSLVWNQPHNGIDLDRAVIIRSCWDYHYAPSDFLAWAKGLESHGVRLFNPASVLAWNHDKTYLQRFIDAGFVLPPTFFYCEQECPSLEHLMRSKGLSIVVIKPTVSATAWKTYLVPSPSQAPGFQKQFEELARSGGALVQGFIPEVQEHGEWSFIFFNRRFSHAVLKSPRAGDFRVQQEFGGKVTWDLDFAPYLLKDAEAILDHVEGPLLYARVDGVAVQGRLCLMELELIEPALFLKAPGARQRFAKTIAEYVRA